MTIARDLGPYVSIVSRRRFADVLLFGVTATELTILVALTPSFTLVDWIYLLQHVIVLAIALTRAPPGVRDSSPATLLATMLETSLHRSLLISGGSWAIFVSTPFSATLVGIAALSILLQIPWVSRPLWSLFRRRFGRSAAAEHRDALRDVE